MTTKSRPRECFYIVEQGQTEGGYIPALVTENEQGFRLMAGDPAKLQSPWVWGPTRDDAQRAADELNARRGLTPEDVVEIVASSMVRQIPRRAWP